ncbi:MAG: protein kinase [Gemmatimonadota bacterium]
MPGDLSRLRSALEGRYESFRELGEGGTATVYLARDVRHGRDVALKVVRWQLRGTTGLERFRQEIQIAAGLQHPNILPLLDSGEVDGLPFFTTPYTEASSLQEVMERQKTLPVKRVCTIVREVADGLDFAHSKGIVHRDVKPGNILISGGHAVLADFGLALAVEADPSERITDSKDGAGGTVWYMSPEQLNGSAEVDARTDIYSLACVAFEMLCGEPPFTGRTAWAVMARQATGTLTSIQVLRPDLPEEANRVFAKALDREPGRRYASAGEFADALIESLAVPDQGGGPAARRVRRALPLVAVAAVIAAVLLWPFSGAPTLDAQRVMVFPLLDDRPDRNGSSEGEEAAIMIGAALDHAEPLHWVDGWDWLDEDVREDMAGWTIRQGTTIAREHGARYVIDGRILTEADSLRVLLRLHDASSGELVQRSLVSGPLGTSRPTELGRRAVIELLPDLIDSSRPVRTDVLTGFQPAAVAMWLQGEREYRHGRFGTSLDLFERAVAADSTMALAAIRGAQAAAWVLRPAVVEDLLSVALRNESELSTRHRLLAEGLRSYYAGEADRALERLRAALQVDPAYADAHMAVGETYYHLMPRDVRGTAQAEAAFLQAARFDPGFTPALVHLAEIALARGDLSEEARYAAEVRQESGDTIAAARHLTLLERCMDNGPGAVAWRQEVTTSPLTVLEAAFRSGPDASQAACAVAAYSALGAVGPPSYGWTAHLGLLGRHLAAGREEEARAQIEGAPDFERQKDYLFVLAALAGGSFQDEADAAVADMMSEADSTSPTRLWASGAWSAARNRRNGIGESRASARQRAAAAGATPSDSLLVDALSAWRALVDADTTAAIAGFEKLAPVDRATDLAWGVWQQLGAERLQLARLLLARGQPARAIQVAEGLDHPQPVVFHAYRPESLRIRAAAAEALGQEADAAANRRRLRQLRAGPVAPSDAVPQSSP